MSTEFEDFVARHVKKISRLEREKNRLYWDAATGGRGRDYRKLAELKFRIGKVYADRAEFEYIRNFVENEDPEDPVISRTARVLYLQYLGMQIGEELLREISDLSSELSRRFNTFRPSLEGREVTDNDIREILHREDDADIRRKAWEGHKRTGELIAPDLIRLVDLRNRGAAEAGFDNFYSMSLHLSETDEDELFELMDRLEELTRAPFGKVKERLDQRICRSFGISADEIMPWHYSDPFFQRFRPVNGFDLNPIFSGTDLTGIAAEYYRSLAMPVEGVLERSDLYQREGKSPHAFCVDIDREGDVRILANITDNAKWMGTLLHELGHAVYDLYIDSSLPYLLRKYPHFCLTEASAMFFEGMLTETGWLRRFAGADLTEKEAGELTADSSGQKLVFSRWCQTMVRFERELYRNPHRDLDSLWWEMVNRYQFVNIPPDRSVPDWAAKIHFVTSPAYYHNYILGALIAAQLNGHIRAGITEDITAGGDQLSGYLKKNIFGPGNLYRWDRLLEKATGESVKPDYYTESLKGDIE